MKNNGLRKRARWALDISGRQDSISSKPGVQDTCRHIALSPYHSYWLPAYQLRSNWTWPALPLRAFQRSGSLSISIPCCFQKQSQQGVENEHHKMHELDHDLKKSTHTLHKLVIVRLPRCWVGNFWAPVENTAEQSLPVPVTAREQGRSAKLSGFQTAPFHLAQEGSRGGLNSCTVRMTCYNNKSWLGLVSNLCSNER